MELAVSEGYKIIKPYQIYHFKHSSDKLFREFVFKMLKAKLEASGYPSHITTDAEKSAYIRKIYENDHVTLDPKNIFLNPSARSYTKSVLNNLWGKFGQRDGTNQSETLLINSSKKLANINDKIVSNKINFSHISAILLCSRKSLNGSFAHSIC